MSAQFWAERLEYTKNLIVQYETAILQIGEGSVQSYSINTGQTTTNVTRFDLARLQAQLPGLYNQLATLEARVNGCGAVIAQPGF
jgi:hypothetical protein